jgi:glycosyltransferase involved in cell wall biosynthesis
MTSTVSVIVPSHNHGAYLNAALISIYAQVGVNLDVIVIDDGSTDDTAEVLAAWKSRGVRGISQACRGASAARNRGLALARGELVAFLDADDLWPCSHMLQDAATHFAQHPDCGWTFGDAQPFDEDAGSKRFQDRPYLAAGGYYKHAVSRDEREVTRDGRNDPQANGVSAAQACKLTPADLCNNDRFFIPTGTLVMRKACLDEVGGFDERLKMFEDTDLWLRMLRYPLAFFPKVLLWRRVHQHNISHRRWAHLDDLRTLFDRYDLASHGVSFDFHAARAHRLAGREAWEHRRFAEAAREFDLSLRHRSAWKPRLWWMAASVASSASALMPSKPHNAPPALGPSRDRHEA